MGKHSFGIDDTQEIPVVTENPTQVEHQWKATVRTAFQVILALAVIIPLAIPAVGLTATAGAGAVIIAVASGVARVMALPSVNEAIDRFLPWLRAR